MTVPSRSRGTGPDRARDEVGRQERRLHAEVRRVREYQGVMDFAKRFVTDYTAVVQGKLAAVNSSRRERNGAKTAGTSCSPGSPKVKGNCL